MTANPLDDPFAGLARDLAAMEEDALGIAALGRAIAHLIAAREAAARERLRITVVAAMLFAGTSATSAAVGLGHTNPGALVIGVIAALSAGTAPFVTRPIPACLIRAHARAVAWWRR